jgi:uncharacterized damage-inducible protein DinB
MPSAPTSLATVYAGWENYHRFLAKAITPLSPEQLALRSAPHLRSIGENAAHIVATRAGWYHHVLRTGDSAFAALGTYGEPGAPEHSAADLVSKLEATWRVMADALMVWTTDDLDDTLQASRNGRSYEFKRGWVIWHVVEHDIHHGGEISLTLGMHNLSGLGL